YHNICSLIVFTERGGFYVIFECFGKAKMRLFENLSIFAIQLQDTNCTKADISGLYQEPNQID
ncbi:MAG: hypothetical protein EBU03_05485, partial [Methylophilaceae bacterium]|nr:hypothetical protein [Methylophilaceae bacterium]